MAREISMMNIPPKRLDRLANQYQIDASRASAEGKMIRTLRRQSKALTEAIQQLQDNLNHVQEEQLAYLETILIENEHQVCRE